MINEIRTFIEKNIPNYIYNSIKNRYSPLGIPDEELELHFTEALENHDDALCAKQRENCANATCVNTNSDVDEFTDYSKHIILNAEQAKIEEI